MASSDGTKQAAHSSAAGDTDALVAGIERTREELAVTIDAIADKVSPKRVAARAKVALKDGAAAARERALEAGGTAKVKVAEVAGTARVKVAEVAGTAKVKVAESTGTAKELVAGAVDRPGHTSKDGAPALGAGEPQLPPAGGVPVPRLAPRPLHSAPGSPSPAVPPEYLAVGGVLATFALLVWWEGRRS